MRKRVIKREKIENETNKHEKSFLCRQMREKYFHLFQNGEGFGIENVDVSILRGHHQAADGVILCVAFLQDGHGGDDTLSPEGNVSEGGQERGLQLRVVLQLQVLE